MTPLPTLVCVTSSRYASYESICSADPYAEPYTSVTITLKHTLYLSIHISFGMSTPEISSRLYDALQTHYDYGEVGSNAQWIDTQTFENQYNSDLTLQVVDILRNHFPNQIFEATKGSSSACMFKITIPTICRLNVSTCAYLSGLKNKKIVTRTGILDEKDYVVKVSDIISVDSSSVLQYPEVSEKMADFVENCDNNAHVLKRFLQISSLTPEEKKGLEEIKKSGIRSHHNPGKTRRIVAALNRIFANRLPILFVEADRQEHYFLMYTPPFRPDFFMRLLGKKNRSAHVVAHWTYDY